MRTIDLFGMGDGGIGSAASTMTAKLLARLAGDSIPEVGSACGQPLAAERGASG